MTEKAKKPKKTKYDPEQYRRWRDHKIKGIEPGEDMDTEEKIEKWWEERGY